MTAYKDNDIPVPASVAGILNASLVVGGAVPYEWDLYDYAPSATAPGTWTKRLVGHGSGTQTIPVGTFAQLSGHSLCWMVMAINYGQTAVADLKAVLIDSANTVYTVTKPGSWSIDPASPQATVFANVVAQ